MPPGFVQMFGALEMGSRLGSRERSYRGQQAHFGGKSTMKKGLLASSALVGASLLGAPAMAAAPTVADNLQLTIVGTMRSTLFVYNQDQDTAPGYPLVDEGKGYTFRGNDESEIRFLARGKADNGLAYGFDVEVQTQTNDSTNADEVWFFIDSPSFGRIEIGDQDDAPDRMMIDGADAQAGRGGNNVGTDTGGVIGRTELATIDSATITRSGDSSKVIYFTPRFSGFQFGASFTPDTGMDGGEDANRSGSNFTDVWGFGVNYQNTFSGARVTVAATYQTGGNEDDTLEGVDIWGVGGQVVYAGFTFAAGYANSGDTLRSKADTAAGADGGNWWNVGLMYTTGKWDFSVGYFAGAASNPSGTPDSESMVAAISATYRVAPGWVLAGDVATFDYQTREATAGADVDGWIFIFSSTLTF
jgi:predicted porin